MSNTTLIQEINAKKQLYEFSPIIEPIASNLDPEVSLNLKSWSIGIDYTSNPVKFKIHPNQITEIKIDFNGGNIILKPDTGELSWDSSSVTFTLDDGPESIHGSIKEGWIKIGFRILSLKFEDTQVTVVTDKKTEVFSTP